MTNGLLTIVESFRNKHILVIGDIMLDFYIYGAVNRVSPEAPVPVVEKSKEEWRLGGAGNVAANIIALGARCSIASRVGNDETGKKILSALSKKGIKSDLVAKTKHISTQKTRVMSGEHQLIRVDQEDCTESDIETQNEQIIDIKNLLDRNTIDLILFQDYNKGFLSQHLIEQIVQYAKNKKIPIAVDPKEKNFFEYKGVNLFKPNQKEFEVAIGYKVSPELESIQAACAQLLSDIQAETLVLTLASKGMYIGNSADGFIYKGVERKVSDVSGAGDSVISILALAYCSNANNLEMAT